MVAIINKFLNKWISKKLFAFLVVTAMQAYATYTGNEIPAAYFGFAAAYVGGQSFIDRYTKAIGHA